MIHAETAIPNVIIMILAASVVLSGGGGGMSADFFDAVAKVRFFTKPLTSLKVM
jgi:hypothetical protein